MGAVEPALQKCVLMGPCLASAPKAIIPVVTPVATGLLDSAFSIEEN